MSKFVLHTPRHITKSLPSSKTTARYNKPGLNQHPASEVGPELRTPVVQLMVHSGRGNLQGDDVSIRWASPRCGRVSFARSSLVGRDVDFWELFRPGLVPATIS